MGICKKTFWCRFMMHSDSEFTEILEGNERMKYSKWIPSAFRSLYLTHREGRMVRTRLREREREVTGDGGRGCLERDVKKKTKRGRLAYSGGWA